MGITLWQYQLNLALRKLYLSNRRNLFQVNILTKCPFPAGRPRGVPNPDLCLELPDLFS
jgi:hypothetical protein